jgi:hypothetical protein
MHSPAVNHNAFGDRSRPSLRDRRELLEDLSSALETPDSSTLLAIFQFINLEQEGARIGAAENNDLCFRVADAFAASVPVAVSWYRLRATEFAALATDPTHQETLAQTIAVPTIRAHDVGFESDLICGSVVVPDEALNVRDAITLADHRLELQRRERGIEPEPLLGKSPHKHGRSNQSSGPLLPSFFRSYDHVRSDYQLATEAPSIRVGQTVRYRRSRYYLQGVSPASLPQQFAELEDVRTGNRLSAPLAEIVADPS